MGKIDLAKNGHRIFFLKKIQEGLFSKKSPGCREIQVGEIVQVRQIS